MEYRIFDKKKQKFLDDDVYMSPDGKLYKSYQTILGMNKLTAMSHDRYVFQKSIDLLDKNGNLIYVGDYLKAQVEEDKFVVGMVIYAQELSSFVILCFDTEEYFTLGESIMEFIEIVGNVFEEFKE